MKSQQTDQLSSENFQFFNKCQCEMDSSHPLISYGKSLMEFESGKVDESLELVEIAKHSGLPNFELKWDKFVEILKTNDTNNNNYSYKVTKKKRDEQRTYICQVCQRKFNKLFTLKRHLKSHFGVKNYGEL